MKTLEEQSEKFLQSKDIWNHPYITDRTESHGYEVRQLLEDFAYSVLNPAQAIEILKERLEIIAGRLIEPIIKQGKDPKEDLECHKALVALAHLEAVEKFLANVKIEEI